MTHFVRALLTGAALAAAAPARAVYAPVPEQEQGKALSVSAKAGVSRDSNIFGSATDVVASTILEFAPRIAYNASVTKQTFVALSYQLKVDQFDNRPGEKVLDSHDLMARVAHEFAPSTTLDLTEIFSSSRNPESLLNGLLVNADQSSKRNEVDGTFSVPVTAKGGLTAKARTVYTAYRNPTLARSLDNIENLYGLSGNYAVQPDVKLVGEYRHQDVFYRKEGELKNKSTDYAMGGVDFSVAKKLTASARAGYQWRHRSSERSAAAPYAEATVKYDYAEDSYFTAGYTFSLEETSNVAAYNDSRVNRFVTSVQHHVTALVVVSATVVYEIDSIQARRGLSDLPEHTWRTGGGVTYLPTKNWVVSATVDHDRVESRDAGRAQRRTRFGINAGYSF